MPLPGRPPQNQLVRIQQAIDPESLGARGQAATQEQRHLLKRGFWGAEQHFIIGGQGLVWGLHVDGQGGWQYSEWPQTTQVGLALL